jgi:hypothetical protein
LIDFGIYVLKPLVYRNPLLKNLLESLWGRPAVEELD